MELNSQRIKPYTLASRTKPPHKAKLAKEYAFANAETRPKKKYDRTTMAIRNAGLSANIKAITSNKLTAKRKVQCLEIPHYA